MKIPKSKLGRIIGLAIVALIVLAVTGMVKRTKEQDWFAPRSKWDGKIVLTQEGVWSTHTVYREVYQDIVWEQLEGSASTFEFRDALHPEFTFPFAEGDKNGTVTQGKVFNYQLRILSRLKKGPVVFGYRIVNR